MRFLVTIALILGLAQGAVAQTKEVSVKRGQTVQIFSWMFFDDNCRTTSIPKIRAQSKPNLGQLKLGTGNIKITRVVDQRQANCIGKTRKGAIVTYTAGLQAGLDKFTLVRKRMNGKDARIRFAVTVR